MEKTIAVVVALLSVLAYGAGVRGEAYVTFMGDRLRNHEFVDLGRVGGDASGSNSLQCHTDLESCCGSAGAAGGNWFTPGNQSVGDSGAVYQVQGEGRVDLRRNGELQSGIYRCDIDTVATGAGAAVTESVYVGLYGSGGGTYVYST